MHYLARMIEAGEDPRFIARRLIISAAEDIGLADPQALPLAVAAADAVQLIGMPEGRIPLAEATAYLATTAKSNAAYVAINRAIEDVRAGRVRPRARRTCATRTTPGPSGWGTARATGTRMTPRSASSRSSICPTSCGRSATTSRRITVRSATCRRAWRRSGASSTARRDGSRC